MGNYNAESIESLDFIEHIRRYPGVYCGSKDINGLHHCLKEIISNSIDEYLNGAGTYIKVIIGTGNEPFAYVEDNGRGIPVGKHETGCSLVEACFGIQNTGGKYDNATGMTGYNTSGGEHGLGAKAVNALSKNMIVVSQRDNVLEHVEFMRGHKVNYRQRSNPDGAQHGLSVKFWPDETVLEETHFDVSRVKKMLQEFSFLCKGLTFYFATSDSPGWNDDSLEWEIYHSKNGLQDYLDYLNEGKTFLAPPIHIEGKEGQYQLEVALGYNNSYSSAVKLYTNNIPQEKGTHLTGFKAALTAALNNFARENKILKDKDENFSGSDFEEGQVLILNFKMIDPVFKGQNKEELSSSEGRIYVQKLAAAELKDYFNSHPKDIKKILEKAVNARKARKAAQKAREAVRRVGKDKKNKFLNLPTKLVDANDPDRSKCEVYITEGGR